MILSSKLICCQFFSLLPVKIDEEVFQAAKNLKIAANHVVRDNNYNKFLILLLKMQLGMLTIFVEDLIQKTA